MADEEDKAREIARLRALIATEYQTMKHDAQGFTGDARHTFVTERMKVLWTYFEQLAALVGDQAEAMALVVESFTTPPTFLQIGPVQLSVASIVGVTHLPGLVKVETLTGLHTFSGHSAASFLSQWQKYRDEGHLLVLDS